VVESRHEKHEFGRLVARIIGAMPEIHARRCERSRNPIDGSANGFWG
jgi:hypothetical protein